MNQLVPSVHLPPLIVAAVDRVRVHFLEFFTANIRNPNTRRAYARRVADFLARFAPGGLSRSSATAVNPHSLCGRRAAISNI
jgi:hypothetical protein